MPFPRFRSFQKSSRLLRLRRGRPDPGLSPFPAVPGFGRAPKRPSSPSVGSNRTRTPDPPRLALLSEKQASPPGSPSRLARFGSELPFAALRHKDTAFESKPSRQRPLRGLVSKRTPSLRHRTFHRGASSPASDPFATSSRSEPRSFAAGLGMRSEASPPSALRTLRIEASSDPSAAGPPPRPKPRLRPVRIGPAEAVPLHLRPSLGARALRSLGGEPRPEPKLGQDPVGAFQKRGDSRFLPAPAWPRPSKPPLRAVLPVWPTSRRDLRCSACASNRHRAKAPSLSVWKAAFP